MNIYIIIYIYTHVRTHFHTAYCCPLFVLKTVANGNASRRIHLATDYRFLLCHCYVPSLVSSRIDVVIASQLVRYGWISLSAGQKNMAAAAAAAAAAAKTATGSTAVGISRIRDPLPRATEGRRTRFVPSEATLPLTARETSHAFQAATVGRRDHEKTPAVRGTQMKKTRDSERVLEVFAATV